MTQAVFSSRSRPAISESALQQGAVINFTVPGEPVAFARAGRNGKISFTPAPQRSFMEIVKMFAQRAMAGRAPMAGPLAMTLRAVYLHPASWSLTKKRRTRFKTSKPDADNIAKLVKDALSKVAYADDAQIVILRVAKRYGPVAQLDVRVWAAGREASA